MNDFKTKMIYLKHIIAAHSITDSSRPILDAYKYYNDAKTMLEKMWSQFLSGIENKNYNFYFSVPKFHYKDFEVHKGIDDFAVDGKLVIQADGYMCPQVEFIFDIKDAKMGKPKRFRHKDNVYEFSSKGLAKFFGDVNPRYELMNAEDKKPSPSLAGKLPATSYFGDPSRGMTRSDYMRSDSSGRSMYNTPDNIMTGDQVMLGRSTGPYVGAV